MKTQSLWAVIACVVSACAVEDAEDTGATDDADDGGVTAHASVNPAPFDLHCLYNGEAYAQRAPNEYAANAIREACDIQARLVPYKFPGMNPWNLEGPSTSQGIDCSGLTAHVWLVATSGWTHLPHSAAWQEKTLPHVSWGEKLPGDLLFYVSEHAASGRHVAMYLGDDLMIEAASSTRGVIVTEARSNVSSIGRVW